MRALTLLTLGLATLGLASPYKGDKGDSQGHEVDNCDGSNDNGHDGAGSYDEGHCDDADGSGHDDDSSHDDDSGHDDDSDHDDDSGHNDDSGHDDDSGHGDDNGHGDDSGHGHCISRAEAHDLAQAYAALVGAFKESDAHHWLADEFKDYSDSINAFTNKPFGTLTFDKTSFVASQKDSSLPPTPITIIGEPVVECGRVAILWSSTFGKGWVARGLTIVEVRENDGYGGDKEGDKGKWLMTRWDVEFNALAWAYNMGQYYCLFGHGVGDPSVCAAPKARGLEYY